MNAGEVRVGYGAGTRLDNGVAGHVSGAQGKCLECRVHGWGTGHVPVAHG